MNALCYTYIFINRSFKAHAAAAAALANVHKVKPLKIKNSFSIHSLFTKNGIYGGGDSEMYSEVTGHSSIPYSDSPDLVYEKEVGGGDKRLSFGDLVTDTDRASPGAPSYHESEYADIPLAHNGNYVS